MPLTCRVPVNLRPWPRATADLSCMRSLPETETRFWVRRWRGRNLRAPSQLSCGSRFRPLSHSQIPALRPWHSRRAAHKKCCVVFWSVQKTLVIHRCTAAGENHIAEEILCAAEHRRRGAGRDDGGGAGAYGPDLFASQPARRRRQASWDELCRARRCKSSCSSRRSGQRTSPTARRVATGAPDSTACRRATRKQRGAPVTSPADSAIRLPGQVFGAVRACGCRDCRGAQERDQGLRRALCRRHRRRAPAAAL